MARARSLLGSFVLASALVGCGGMTDSDGSRSGAGTGESVYDQCTSRATECESDLLAVRAKCVKERTDRLSQSVASTAGPKKVTLTFSGTDSDVCYAVNGGDSTCPGTSTVTIDRGNGDIMLVLTYRKRDSVSGNLVQRSSALTLAGDKLDKRIWPKELTCKYIVGEFENGRTICNGCAAEVSVALNYIGESSDGSGSGDSADGTYTSTSNNWKITISAPGSCSEESFMKGEDIGYNVQSFMGNLSFFNCGFKTDYTNTAAGYASSFISWASGGIIAANPTGRTDKFDCDCPQTNHSSASSQGSSTL